MKPKWEELIGMRSRKGLIIGTACLFFGILAGCGTGKFDTTTLVFESKGELVLHIVDEFDENEYDYEELKALNEAEVNVYNSYGKGKATIEGSNLKDGIVRIDIRYDSDDAYFDMNNVVLFYGNVDEARNAGYNLTGKVTGTSGEGLLEQNAWADMKDQRVVVVSEEIAVNMPGKILYAGDGVTLTGAKNATVEGEGLHYIIGE